MAKFAQVGYGHDGRGVGQEGKGYTYVVNDNVRSGDILFPVVKHAQSETIFATVGKVIKNREMPNNEQAIKRTFEDIVKKDKNGKDVVITKDDLTNAYKQSELGVKKQIGMTKAEYREQAERSALAVGLADARQKNPNAQISQGERTQYLAQTFDKATQFKPAKQETFDSYSKQFMGEQK